jgi:hypothetical protein
MPDRFKIVYEKLDEELKQDSSVAIERIAILDSELDEIAELRRLSAALAEPERRSYTIS